jgi:hypothetical protein
MYTYSPAENKGGAISKQGEKAMAEENKDEIIVEEKTEDTVEDSVEEKTEDKLPDIVNKIREEYEMLIAEMEAKHAAAIADRDAIIQQLISGNLSGNVLSKTSIDKINEKRNFKKW